MRSRIGLAFCCSFFSPSQPGSRFSLLRWPTEQRRRRSAVGKLPLNPSSGKNPPRSERRRKEPSKLSLPARPAREPDALPERSFALRRADGERHNPTPRPRQGASPSVRRLGELRRALFQPPALFQAQAQDS